LKKDYSESTMEDVPEVALFATWEIKKNNLSTKNIRNPKY